MKKITIKQDEEIIFDQLTDREKAIHEAGRIEGIVSCQWIMLGACIFAIIVYFLLNSATR